MMIPPDSVGRIGNEVNRLQLLTGVNPGQLESVEGYNNFLDHQIARFSGKDVADQALRFMIAKQKVRQP